MARINVETVPSINIESASDPSHKVREVGNQTTTPSSSGSHENRGASLTFKHATAESFVSGLKRLSAKEYAGSSDSEQIPPPDSYSEGSTDVSSYDYASLSFDASCK